MSNLPGPYLYPTVTNRFKTEMLARSAGGHGLKRVTLQSYSSTYKMLQAAFPGRRFDEFTAEHLVTFLRSTAEERSWKSGTLSGKRNALVSLWGWAAEPEVGLCPLDDPMTVTLRRRVPVTVQTHREGHWLQPYEIGQLFSTLPPSSDVLKRDRFLFQFFLGSGLRCFEGSNVTWADLDLGSGTLRVNHGKGKGVEGKPRTVQLLPQLVEAAQEWRETVAKGIGGIPTHHPLLPRAWSVLDNPGRARGKFTGGNPREKHLWWDCGLSTSGIRLVVTTRTAAAGIAGVAPHDLRRSYAGILEDNGVPIQDISRNLGHASVNTTMRYLSDNLGKRAKALANVTAW